MNNKTYLEPTESFHKALENTLSNLPEAKKAHRPPKAAIIGLAAAAALCVSAAAGSLIVYQTSWSSAEPDFNELPSQNELESRFGYPYKAVEEFSNGFAYAGGFTTHNEQYDGGGEYVGEYESFSCGYERGGETVTLITREAVGTDLEFDGEPAESFKGLDLYYTAATFFLVPDNLEITPEDDEALKRGEYSFSFGNYEPTEKEKEEISSGESRAAFSHIGSENQTTAIKHQRSVEWIDNGRLYWLSFVGQDSVSKDELIGMAREIIN